MLIANDITIFTKGQHTLKIWQYKCYKLNVCVIIFKYIFLCFKFFNFNLKKMNNKIISISHLKLSLRLLTQFLSNIMASFFPQTTLSTQCQQCILGHLSSLGSTAILIVSVSEINSSNTIQYKADRKYKAISNHQTVT